MFAEGCVLGCSGAVVVVELVGGWIARFECGGHTGAPGAAAVAGVAEDGVGWSGEDVCGGFGDCCHSFAGWTFTIVRMMI